MSYLLAKLRFALGPGSRVWHFFFRYEVEVQSPKCTIPPKSGIKARFPVGFLFLSVCSLSLVTYCLAL